MSNNLHYLYAAVHAARFPKLSAAQHAGLDTFLRKSAGAMDQIDKTRVWAAMSTTTPGEGGYLVAPAVAQQFVDTMKGYGWMRQVATPISTENGAALSYPGTDGTAEVGEALAQNASSTSLDMTFFGRSLNAHKVGSKVFTVPIELVQDAAFDIVSYVMARARARIGRVQNLQFTTGNGTTEPTGLVTAAAVGKTGTTGQTLTVTYDDLVDLVDSVDEGSLEMPDASSDNPAAMAPGWMFNQTTRKVIRKLKDSNGRPLWLPTYEDRSRDVGRHHGYLLGYPVYINNDMPSPGASAKSIAFGNLSSYVVRDVAEVELHRMDDSSFLRAGQVGFLATARAGGNLLDTSAVKVYQHSAT
ncbi:phage major capsid protein [Sphaerotilus mobilis]|uniref:HK97 family phage major capsid protein n=1 Tax=Sphaerotilus mobilis TaxID=47994 RepID=A0A4Q7LBQ5_9BURK|nr:phage major capsid protein [Sphaerotilus mobilis]RZS47494.1 HK97 family phage major capsid protein [Sphaerotilus mobilis]